MMAFIDGEDMKWSMASSDFLYAMANRMQRLEKRLARARRTENEIMMELYRRINYI